MKTGVVLAGLALLAAFLGSRGPASEAAPCPRGDEPRFEGSKSCQKCHFKEYASWQKTKMAQAFKSLKPGEAAEGKKQAKLDPAKDYTRDPGCVSCHVTGYGKPGGYPAIVEGKEWTLEEKARAPLMEGVGCESCHGPGEKTSPYKKDRKEYRWADIVKLGAVHPDAKLCATCHNPQSPTFKEFTFEEKVGKDTHDLLKLKYDHACDHAHRPGK
jgi:hypothetical protein